MTINSILEEIRNYKKENSRVRRRRKYLYVGVGERPDHLLVILHFILRADTGFLFYSIPYSFRSFS